MPTLKGTSAISDHHMQDLRRLLLCRYTEKHPKVGYRIKCMPVDGCHRPTVPAEHGTFPSIIAHTFKESLNLRCRP